MDSLRWWERAVIYEIVVQSFQDSNGDGMGDLRGIIEKLPYLQWLGVDAVWLTPVHPSPHADFGYDIADHYGIHPAFGTLSDFDELVEQLHQRRMRLLLDFVPNHTSNEHPWFAESASSPSNAKRDWYFWKSARGDGPPNNWMSVFGGSAWTRHAATGDYYFHSFTAQEPDLNWRNPGVREAMFNVLRYWRDRGVDGFRVDACWYLLKDDAFRNNPPNPNWTGERDHEQLSPAFSENMPGIHELLREFRNVADEKPGTMLMGELYLPTTELHEFYGRGDELHLPANFGLLNEAWTPEQLAFTISTYEGSIGPDQSPNWAVGNHDKSRIATRLGPGRARLAALLLFGLRGTLVLYYGDEIGMRDVPEAAQTKEDPQTADFPNGNRMPFRTPMLWSEGENAGFTTGKPWLPTLPADHAHPVAGVDAQREDPNSLLSLYRRLILLRKNEPALLHGDYVPLPIHGGVLAFTRRSGGRHLLVAINLGDNDASYPLPHSGLGGRVLVATWTADGFSDFRGNVPIPAQSGLMAELFA